MNKWLRKSFVVLISILTFGLITPPLDVMDAAGPGNSSESEAIRGKNDSSFSNADSQDDENSLSRERFIEDMLQKAEMQSYQKFGPKIKPVIENEFKEVILPNIEKALEEVAYQFPEEDFGYMAISERPGGGTSEKIFHIQNRRTAEDIIRFHVRRDNPPQQGYWFNFHYHTYHDHFQNHYTLGSIFWDKNTPPKWMN